MLLVIIVSPFGNSAHAASVANGSQTLTLSYGTHGITNEFNAGDLRLGDAGMRLTTYVTLSAKGATITKLLQENYEKYPYSVDNKGTSIVTKTSPNNSTLAHSVGKFYVAWKPLTSIPIGTDKTWELHTYIRVTDINETKKTVTITVGKTGEY
ncbi:hypothetical protein [Peribacillus sp. SCS-155]|uniref:hypothetical protein n=1 Tax=Peribacillus sedimenti TaxID=3115297 RepID=UPI003905DCFA